MNPVPYPFVAPPPWVPILPPNPPMSSSFWEAQNVHVQLQDLQDTVNFAKAMEKELEMLIMIRDAKGSTEDADNASTETSFAKCFKFLEDNQVNLAFQESLSLEAANSLISKLRLNLEPFKVVTDETSPWEEKSAAVRLANKVHKSKRNKRWRKRKRKHIAELLAKERQIFDQADQEADEWRAREIAKDIAKRKVEKMKEIAKLKAKEERERLESELELVLMVEKLQELRSLRIEKLKKQGHFMPEEDNNFVEKIRASFEEEEREAMAAAETDAAMDAIATAEAESRKLIQGSGSDSNNLRSNNGQVAEGQDHIITEREDTKDISSFSDKDSRKQGSLPIEFYHYYHGSSNDMGTLIEVRRTWDAYIRPGGSRIPGHWVHPPPPADEIWASYLASPS